MTVIKTERAVARVDGGNPDHHLYDNNGTWWVHYTAYPDAVRAERVRRSLRTRDRAEARRRRDELFAGIFGGAGKGVAS